MSYLVNPPFLAAIMKRWELRVSQALGDDLYFSPAWTRKYRLMDYNAFGRHPRSPKPPLPIAR